MRMTRHDHRSGCHRRRCSVAFAAAIGASLAAPAARATIYTWIGSGTTNWSNSANWQGSAIPTSAPDTILIINALAAQSFAANNDIASPFKLEAISFFNLNTGTTQFISGAPLEFVNNTSNGVVNSFNSINGNPTGPFQVQNNLILDGFTPINLGTAGTLMFSGTISGVGSMTIGGGNVAITASNSFTGGTTVGRNQLFVTGLGNLGTGSTLVGDDILSPTIARAVFDSSANITSGPGSVTLKPISYLQFNTLDGAAISKINPTSSGVLALTPTTSITAGSLDLSGTTGAIRIGTYIPGGTGSVTFSTAITPSGGVYRFGGQDFASCDYIGADVLNVTSPLTNSGLGTPRSVEIGSGLLNRTGKVKISNVNNSYTGGTTVDSSFGSAGISALTFDYAPTPGQTPLGTGSLNVYGALMFEGTFGALGSLPNTINFNPGSELYFNNTFINSSGSFDVHLDRWGDSQAMNLNGTRVLLRALLANGQAFTEKVGAVSFADGSKIVLDKSSPVAVTNGTLTLAMDSLTRVGHGTMEITELDAGNFALSHQVQVNDTSSIVDPTTGMVAPYIAGDRFPGVSAPTGEYFQVVKNILTPYSYLNGFNVSSNTDVVSPSTSTSINGSGPETIWAGRFGLSSTLTISSSASLVVQSGGIILDSAISGGSLSFRNNGSPTEALLYVGTTNSGTITSIIDASAGLTKFGTGTLVIGNNANTIAGGININDGTLQVNSSQPNSLGSNNVYISFNGRLDVNGMNVTLPGITGTGSVLSNNSTSTGTLTLNIASGTDTFNGTLAMPTTSRTFAVVKTGNGTFVMAGQDRYVGLTSVNTGTYVMSGQNIGIVVGGIHAGYGDYSTTNGAALVFQNNSNTVGAITGGGSTYLGPTAGMVITANVVRQSVLNIGRSATMRIAPNGTSTATSVLSELDFAIANVSDPISTLDLTNNNLVIDYTGASPIATVQNAVKFGYHNGAWNGPGITSSTAATSPGMALGYAEASSVFSTFPATFSGQSVDNTSVLVRYTFAGDANLDGTVDTGDFTAMSQHFGSSGQGWVAGDFNYDGTVNALDFNALATNYGRALASPALGSLVPEPQVLFAAVAFGVALRRSRRRSDNIPSNSKLTPTGSGTIAPSGAGATP
jgi:autotransporter-associated beta strand protein